MNRRTLLFAIAAGAVIACGQTTEEKVKAFEEAHDAMIKEYREMILVKTFKLITVYVEELL